VHVKSSTETRQLEELSNTPDIEIDYCTDEYENYYAELLDLGGDPCSWEGQSLLPIYCDAYGAKGIQGATEKLHMMIKHGLTKKCANKANSAEDKEQAVID